MFRIRALLVAALALLATLASLVAGVTVASSQVAPPPPDDGGALPAPVTTQTQIISHGASIWTFVLVVVLTAIVTVAITLLAIQRQRRQWHPLAA